MASAISFSGLASGINSDEIIKAILDTRRIPILSLENKLTFNRGESDALEELNTKLLALRDSLEGFLTRSGGAIGRLATSTNNDAIGAVASNSALATSTTINVTSIAKSATFSFNDRFSATNTPIAPGLSAPTQFTVTVGTGTDAKSYSVDVTNETTLADLTTALNEAADDDIVASIVNVSGTSTPEYALLINGRDTGEAKGTLAVNPGVELQGLGLFGSYSEVQASDAIFTVTGLGEVRRSSNTIGDLIPGVTLELKQENVGPVTISVGNDVEKTSENVGAFIAALNEVISFSREKSKVEIVRDEENNTSKAEYDVLARTRTDDLAVDSIRFAMQGTASTAPATEERILADIGIKTDWHDGSIIFDAEEFKKSLAADPDSVAEILTTFADKLGTATGVIEKYTQFDGLIDVALKGNTDDNASLTEQIARIERGITAEEERLRGVFTRLETTVGRLNSQASALTSILASLQASTTRRS